MPIEANKAAVMRASASALEKHSPDDLSLKRVGFQQPLVGPGRRALKTKPGLISGPK